MAENKMKQVAEMLGVEMGAPFKIKGEDRIFYINEKGLHCKDINTYNLILVKILKGELEIEKPILDDVEKCYLEGVLRPFKDKVKGIKKNQNKYGQWIYIEVKEDWFGLPYFEKDTMYKGMELDKEYTLQELGLFEDEV